MKKPKYNTPEYWRQNSRKRREYAAENGLCAICIKRKVTKGLHGPLQRPWSTCKACRSKKADEMKRRRKEQK